MNLIQLPLALIASNPLFVTKLGLAQLPAVLGVGISGLASHYCLANAFRWGDASVVVPLDFLRIPLIAVVGWWLYGEQLDVFVFIGAALIVAGILWNLRSEAARAVRPIELKTQRELPPIAGFGGLGGDAAALFTLWSPLKRFHSRRRRAGFHDWHSDCDRLARTSGRSARPPSMHCASSRAVQLSIPCPTRSERSNRPTNSGPKHP